MKRYSHSHVQSDGEVIVFERLEVEVDGEIARGDLVGRVLNPGDDASGEVAEVRAIAAAVHTPECVAAFTAQQQLAAAQESVRVAVERVKSADTKRRAAAQQEADAAQADADAKKQVAAAARAAYENSKHSKVPTKR